MSSRSRWAPPATASKRRPSVVSRRSGYRSPDACQRKSAGRGRGRGGLVPRQLDSPSRRGGGAEAVAGIVVGEDERVLAREARAVVGRGRVAGVVIEADDPVLRDTEVIGDEAEPLALGNAELSPGGVREAKLRPHLARAPAQRPPGRGQGHAVVLPRVRLVVEHAVEPLARGRAGAREGHDVDVRGREAALLEKGVDGQAWIAGVVLQPGEALFGGAAHDAAVPKDGRRGAVGFVDAEDDHVPGIIPFLSVSPSPCPLPRWGRGIREM